MLPVSIKFRLDNLIRNGTAANKKWYRCILQNAFKT